VTRRLRLGVVGTGLIAQIMHLHHLAEMKDQFELTAVCDIVPGQAGAIAAKYGIAGAFTDWRDLIAEPLDAVLVLTTGSHAPICIAAARAGLHVLVEKPVCYSVAEGREMLAAAEQAGTVLMVGYPKRFDPAYTLFSKEAAGLSGTRLLRVTTMESPMEPYIGHYGLLPPAVMPAGLAGRLKAEHDAAIGTAIGDGASDFERHIYHQVLLDSMVHELNAVRGLLGEPDRLDYVSARDGGITAMMQFGEVPVNFNWIDLPGIARYEMEFAFFAPDRRITLSFPSPFLRNEPATVVIEGGEAGAARSWRSSEVVSYESGFKREIAAFYDCVVNGESPVTSGLDAVRDVALCEAIIACHRSGQPVEAPTRPAGL
jgi:predicted dehydrogenase